jgi:hypothetical protein
MTPFYERLPNVTGFSVGTWVDPVGMSLAALTGAAVVAHGVGQAVRQHRAAKLPGKDSGSEAES